MKALIALLLCGSALAQSPPAVPWFKGGVSEVYPPRIVQGTTGVHIYWFYANNGAMAASGFSCPVALCDAVKFSQTLNTIATSSNKLAALDKAWKDNVYDCPKPVIINGVKTMADPLCREWANLLVANRATWAGYVAPPKWTVKPNGTQTTRQVQIISADNGLMTASGERVAIGAPCYPEIRSFTNVANNTYAAIDPARPDRVAVCVKG